MWSWVTRAIVALERIADALEEKAPGNVKPSGPRRQLTVDDLSYASRDEHQMALIQSQMKTDLGRLPGKSKL